MPIHVAQGSTKRSAQAVGRWLHLVISRIGFASRRNFWRAVFVARDPIGIITSEYFDQTIEPKGAVLFRPFVAVDQVETWWDLGGYKQKVTHLVKGIESGHYIDQEPYVLESGFNYARDWGFLPVGFFNRFLPVGFIKPPQCHPPPRNKVSLNKASLGALFVPLAFHEFGEYVFN